MKVISNTSPLSNLAAIGEVELLRVLYGQVLIPEAVYRVTVPGAQPGAVEVNTLDWIVRQACQRVDLVQALRGELDAGEAETITLLWRQVRTCS